MSCENSCNKILKPSLALLLGGELVNQAELLEQVAKEVSVCQKCPLSYSRKLAVPGEGPSNSEIMFIGEGPGFYENEQGRPFVGAAGQFLRELLQKAGLNREQVFITNVVKCRPPGNRDPMPDELAACNDYLDRQIEAIQPVIIVTLGRYSMAKFLGNVRISDVHGSFHWVNGRLIVPMFHPAAALHQPSLKGSVIEDFSRLPEYLSLARKNHEKMKGIVEDKPEETLPPEPPEDATQLSLF
jgi:uracil-DNA glycosylase family 4